MKLKLTYDTVVTDLSGYTPSGYQKITYHPNSKYFYFLNGNSLYKVKSNDEGEILLNNSITADVLKISKNGIIYALTQVGNTFQVSVDGGISFQTKSLPNSITSAYLTDPYVNMNGFFRLCPVTNNILFFNMRKPSVYLVFDIYVSTDAGNTWNTYTSSNMTHLNPVNGSSSGTNLFRENVGGSIFEIATNTSNGTYMFTFDTATNTFSTPYKPLITMSKNIGSNNFSFNPAFMNMYGCLPYVKNDGVNSTVLMYNTKSIPVSGVSPTVYQGQFLIRGGNPSTPFVTGASPGFWSAPAYPVPSTVYNNLADYGIQPDLYTSGVVTYYYFRGSVGEGGAQVMPSDWYADDLYDEDGHLIAFENVPGVPKLYGRKLGRYRIWRP